VLTQAWAELDGFAQVPLPVLFVHGADDPVVPVTDAREWAGRLKGARLAEFAGSRHDILNEAVHREVAAAITDFVLTGGGRPTATSEHNIDNADRLNREFDRFGTRSR
jgi:alpha-beta hydrolase superfamily lysophospholipase